MIRKKIQILIDNPNSWMWSHIEKLKEKLIEIGLKFNFLSNHEDVEKGDILILLSCNNVFKRLDLNEYNLVVHESELPNGKGWSPLTWQVIEGKNIIPITLFEASEDLDSGKIYLKDNIFLSGYELIDEIRLKQAELTFKLIIQFLISDPYPRGMDQSGTSSFYPRRSLVDSKLDPEKSIIENFNLLRVCDNIRYPAFFEFKENKYQLIIKKLD